MNGRGIFTRICAAVCLLSAVQLLMAEESIDDLLKTYRKVSDLSKKTKKENAGFVVVYTRDDLERMQVTKLSDILRELRFTRYNLNNFGMVDPFHADPFFYTSDSVKVYVNNHEITSGFSGSGLQFYGMVDMGMFDHVEVYYHAPVLDVATEPAAIVIKLYTKVPERENGGSLVMRISERGSQEVSLSHARIFDTWSYYAYAQESVDNFRHFHNEAYGRDYEISRDYKQKHLFFDLHKKEHRFEFEYLGQTHDPFTAQSVSVTPTGGEWDQPVARISYSGEWLEGRLHTDLSYIFSTLHFDMTSDSPFWGQYLIGDIYQVPNRFHMNVQGDLFTAKGYYEEKMGKAHLVKVGMEYRYKNATLDDYYFNDFRFKDRKGSMNIGSIYAQDQIELQENAMLTFSLKYNYFDFRLEENSNQIRNDSLDTWQGRIAFSTILDNWYFKAFATHVEFPTQLYVLALHDYDLESQKYDALSCEIKRLGHENDFRLFLSQSWLNNLIAFTPVEHTEVYHYYMEMFNASFDYTYRISLDHRFDFNLNWTRFSTTDLVRKKNYLAGYVRLLDTFGKVDLFNELIYRESTPHLATGWDYSAGLVYHADKDLKFSIKGVNLLAKAQKEYFMAPTAYDTQKYIALPIVEKRILFSMEWLF